MRRAHIAAGIVLLSVVPMANQAAPAEARSSPSRPAPLTRSATLTHPAYTQAVLNNHPIAYWHLAEQSGTNVNDRVGRHDGIYLGTPERGQQGLISWWANLCPRLDGVNDRISVNSMARGISWRGGFALEIWVRIAQRNVEEHLVAFNQLNGGNGPAILRDEPTDRFKYRDGEGTPGHVAFSKMIPQVGVRYHVVVSVRRSGQGWFYVNGSLQDTFTTSGRPPGRGGFFTIGAEYDGGRVAESFYHGKVDEVAVYNHPISALAVKTHWLVGT